MVHFDIKFTKRTNLVFTFIMCILLLLVQIKTESASNIEYFHKINKTQLQIKHDRTTNIELRFLRLAPVVIAYIQCNPILHLSYSITLLTALPTCEILKTIVKRPRPDDAENRKSFPSGHATIAFCSAMTLFLYLHKRRYWRLVSIASFSLAFAVVYGRILANRHFPTDVACGAFIGCCFSMISYFLIAKTHIISFDKK